MLFTQVYLFFLAGSFQLSFHSAPPSAHFIYHLLCYPRLSIFKSLILLIWFCMYSVCSFRYMLANLFCAFLIFRALILVGFLLLHLEVVFMSACFVLTTNVSHGTLGLFNWYAFCCRFLVGIDKILMFVIRSGCFWYPLKCIEFVS